MLASVSHCKQTIKLTMAARYLRVEFTTIQNDKRNSYRRKVREQQIAAKASAATEHLVGSQDPSGSQESAKSPSGRDTEPAAKKARREDGAEDDEEDEDMDDTVDAEDPEDEEEEDEEVEDDDVDDEDDDEEEEGKGNLEEDPLEAKEDVDPDVESGDESD